MGQLKHLQMLQLKLNLQCKNYLMELLLSSQQEASFILEKVKERGRKKTINRSKCFKKLIKPEIIGIVMILLILLNLQDLQSLRYTSGIGISEREENKESKIR